MDDAERRATLDRWFRSYADQVLSYLEYRTDPQTAEEIVQEVFIAAGRKAKSVPDPPITWLLATARQMLANHKRSRDRQQNLLNRAPAHHPEVDSTSRAEVRLIVRAALDQLSPDDKDALIMTVWCRLSNDQNLWMVRGEVTRVGAPSRG